MNTRCLYAHRATKYTYAYAHLNPYLNTHTQHARIPQMQGQNDNVIWRKWCQFCHVSQKGQIANVSFFAFILIILSSSKSLHQKGAAPDKGRPELTDKLNLRLFLTLSSLYLAYLLSSHTQQLSE